LTESLQRAATEQATKDEIDALADELGLDIGRIKEDLRALGGQIEAIAATRAKTTTIVVNQSPSDTSTPTGEEVPVCEEDGRPIDIHGYTRRTETRRLRDSNGMVIADTSFSAGRENPWDTRVFGIDYLITSTISTDNSGRYILHTELTAASAAEPEYTYRIPGIESRVLQAPEQIRFEWWDPSLYLVANLGVGVWPAVEFSAALDLGFSIMSYGDWRFIGLLAGIDAANMTFHAGFFPFAYNVGSPIPFLSDVWLAPYIGIDHTSEVSVGVGIGTRL
jgi:hypothetical protein